MTDNKKFSKMTDNKKPNKVFENKKPVKVVEKQEQESEEDKNLAQQKKGRVIIRNLIFDISEKLLKGLLGKFGEITEISIPVNPSNNKSKGFAFVQFANKNCALKAISELNGTQWKGRSIVLDMAVSKDEFKSHQNPEEKQNKKDEKEKDDKADKMEEENEEDDDEESEDDEDEEEDDEEEEEIKKKEVKNKEKKLFQNEDLSKTCFVRNLSYDATDSDLRKFCQTFGKVEMAKVCMNHETGNNKGTGFVKFSDPNVTLRLIAKSFEASENFLQQKHNKGGANNIHDIFQGVSELDLEMNGRRIIFLEAKKRDDVNKLMEEMNERNSTTLDKVKTLDQLERFDRQGKRNVHLGKLGIFEEEKNMTTEEKEKRRIHLEEKLTKLKNPNNYVSTTRIALMNLPKVDFQEEEIKVYAQAALVSAHGSDYFKKQNPIKQVLLLRDKNKVDKEGVPKSRGIGFLEFNTHEEALSFLEYCVKDKANFERKYKKTPIIEFSIEDARKMSKKNKFLEKTKQKQLEKKKDLKPKTQEEKQEKKVLLKNSNEAAKLQIETILKSKNDTDMNLYEEGKAALKNIKSRGIKQRMAKMLRKKFHQDTEEEQVSKVEQAINKQEEKVQLKKTKEEKRKQLLKQKVVEEKQQKKVELKKKAKEIDDELDADASELIKAVSRELKKNKERRQNLEDYDEFDDVTEKYLQKKVKKLKQETSAL